ncbi:hypothetical protein RFI_13491 [Reticulomyxa filosa]|uniref:C2H2-type domain-containing protein n=1 Tax=Reticulomyxa filosa TaxID=46433 RepID=X6NCR5_RETFI|nr:hypothetical protein RFI_13491 [Reticulomyxa filosa]|eukprot:ETO23688.1 hypothetical protein RFI_13491 [Reticulomyxa filosa]
MFSSMQQCLRHKIKCPNSTVYKNRHKDYICEICHSIYPTKKKLSSHMRNVHLRPLKCDVDGCSKSFGCITALKRHTITHLQRDQKFVICDYCDTQFRSKNALQKHIEICHNKLKPFVCQHCDKAFSRFDILHCNVFSFF